MAAGVGSAVTDVRSTIRARLELIQAALQLDAGEVSRKFQHLSDSVGPEPFHFDHLGQVIDHTCLKPDATAEDIKRLCLEAVQHKFYAVCVNGSRLELARESLELAAGPGHSVKVAVVIGFPLGATTTTSKVMEAAELLSLKADEIDMVLNIGQLKDANYRAVFSDIQRVAAVTASYHKILKVIFETCLLTREQIIDAAILSVLAGANFVKTSTGFSTFGAKEDDVRLMKTTVGANALVKASGGVRSQDEVLKMIAAGAARIGTSSGVAIVNHQSKPPGESGKY